MSDFKENDCKLCPPCLIYIIVIELFEVFHVQKPLLIINHIASHRQPAELNSTGPTTAIDLPHLAFICTCVYDVNAEQEGEGVHVYTAGFLSVSQVETTPSQFADPSVYLWNISNNGELLRLEGLSAPPLRRTTHCADYATIRQQVHLPTSPTFSSF